MLVLSKVSSDSQLEESLSRSEILGLNYFIRPNMLFIGSYKKPYDGAI